MNYSRHYHFYASGSTPYQLTDQKPLPYSEQIHRLVQEVKEADCVVVGGASGLSAAGGGDFYYEDNDSYRKYFRPFAEKYHFKGAFAGMMHPWETREEYWGYLATFLHTTQTAPVRHPYLDLDALLKGKDFFVLTTNQDTQFVKLYPEEKVAEIQGDHRFFQCAACCTDDIWDAVKPVADMVAAMGDGTKIPTDLIPRCPHCGGLIPPAPGGGCRGATPSGTPGSSVSPLSGPFPASGSFCWNSPSLPERSRSKYKRSALPQLPPPAVLLSPHPL